MKIQRHIRLLALGALALLTASCQGLISHYDPPICDYTVQLQYHYNLENTATGNLFERYVKSLDAYIFDEAGVLYAIEPVTTDECTGSWVTELLLPPGKYSVIAVGNRSAMSRIHDNSEELMIGTTHRDDLLLTLTNRSVNGSDDGRYCANTGRLYHGYRTFSVSPTDISYVRVDMVHSHLDLRYTIRWKNNKYPVNSNDFFVILRDLPSEYKLMPEYIYPDKNTCEEFDCGTHELYNSVCQTPRQHIPQVRYDCNTMDHRRNVTLFGNAISGQTLTYRIRNCGEGRIETKISLWRDNSSRTGEAEQLMKEISLNDFLNRSRIDLDRTLKQQYHIVFEIDYDTGQVSAWFSTISDWDEGGGLS